MISRMLNRRRFLGYGLGVGGAVLTGGLASNLTGCQKASETAASAAA
ncbi:MAG TPA: spermidine/putrescine ABC transporter substrate-binding protein, partial [Moraxella sp.]|nr:spermidine/putrescine ABC transporter substrate-binding protein [Moraxella sp.]